LRWTFGAIVLALGGCKLLGSGGEARIEPPGPIYTADGLVTVRVVEAVKHARAELLLDGSLLGTFPVGQDVRINLFGQKEGSYSLVARVYDGERAIESNEVEIVVDRTPPRVSVEPAPGEIVRDGPLTVSVDFGEAVDPASVVAELFSDGAPPARVPATAELQPGGRRLAITTASPFLDVEPVTLKVKAKDLAGNSTETQAPWVADALWWAPTLRVSFLVEPFRAPASGVVLLVPEYFQPAGVSAVDVAVDGVALGRVVAGQRLSWDTRAVADGPHEVTFRAAGYRPYRSEIVTDNTGPALISCAPIGTAPDDASLSLGVLLTFSSEVCAQLGSTEFDRQHCYDPWGPLGPDGSWSASKRVGPPLPVDALPFSWRVDASAFQDRAGNRAAATASCTIDYPAWRKPWGTAQLAVQDGAPMGEAVLRFKGFRTDGPDMGYILRIAPAGSVRPGAVERLVSDAPGAWMPDGPALNGDPLATAARIRGPAWAEIDISGRTRIWMSPWFGPVAVPIATREATQGPLVLADAAGLTVGWIETGTSGARQVQLAELQSETSVTLLPLVGNTDPAGEVVAASVSADPFAHRVAVVERLAGGLAVLRVMELAAGAGNWISLGGTLNRDPQSPASEPAVGALSVDGGYVRPIVAWVEGGQVLSRVDLGSGFESPQVMNADPAAGAHSPVASSRHLVFVERGPGGDRFEVREWDDTGRAWRALPSLVAGGDVVSYTAYGLTILWRDAAGGYHLRGYNDIR